jgi:hypothetical protein
MYCNLTHARTLALPSALWWCLCLGRRGLVAHTRLAECSRDEIHDATGQGLAITNTKKFTEWKRE